MHKRTLFIIRGLPGSGKSTLGETLAPGHCYAADDYFVGDDGVYRFDPRKLSDAHAQCVQNVGNAMRDGTDLVAVANTFSESWEADRYSWLAQKHGYTVFVVECQSNFGSIHNVPERTIARMRRRWQSAASFVEAMFPASFS